jgi:uncharacterized Zn-binding protein involved in type VI secretion
MANERTTFKDSRFLIVYLASDVCWTPIGDDYVPVPYPIMHDMSPSEQCSSDTFINGKPVFLHHLSYVDDVKGDEPGTGGGVISGVNVRISHSIEHSNTYFINGHAAVRTGDRMWMNGPKP